MIDEQNSFTITKLITFGDADQVGIMYFANIFKMAHDAFESFIIDSGFGWKNWFSTDNWLLPIRHSEANYFKPLIPGESYQIEITTAHLGDTSFKIRFRFNKSGPDTIPLELADSAMRVLHTEVFIVQTCLDSKTKQKIPIPEHIRRHLENFYAPLRGRDENVS